MDDTAPWTCPTRQLTGTTPFCARCGEEPLPPRDLTLRGLVEKIVHALTSIDARAARSAWTLLRHPGRLTLAWTSGVRKPYVAPSLASHLHHQDWSDLAQSLLAHRLEAKHASLEQYEPVFDRTVVLNAKSLIC